MLALCAAGVLVAVVFPGAASAQQSCADPVAIQTESGQDVCAQFIAIGTDGNASSGLIAISQDGDAVAGSGLIGEGGIALSGNGDASSTNGMAGSLTGDASNSGTCNASPILGPLNPNCWAFSGVGDASNTGSCNGGFWFAGSVPRCIAVSVGGDASNTGGDSSCGSLSSFSCVAASGTGSASNSFGNDSCGQGISNGCLAASGTGNASNTVGDDSCGSGAPNPTGPSLTEGPSTGCHAVSGTGNASNTAGEDSCGVNVSMGCFAGSAAGDASNQAGQGSCGSGVVATGCVAGSVGGDALNSAGDDSCASGQLTAGCIASSAGGNASNTAGSQSCGAGNSNAGCDAFSALGESSNTTGDSSCGAEGTLLSLSVPMIGDLQLSGAANAACIAASAAGGASNQAGEASCGSGTGSAGCVAASKDGEASNDAGADSCGAGTSAVGCVAASHGGDAANAAGDASCGAGSQSVGCVSASGGGQASNEGGHDSCGAGGAEAGTIGCVAASGGEGEDAVSNEHGEDSCGTLDPREVVPSGCMGASPDGGLDRESHNPTPGILPPTAHSPDEEDPCAEATEPVPVILLHGTGADMSINWPFTAPLLTQAGYCVFAMDYGERGTGPIRESAQQLADFVDAVRAATGAPKVSILGWSQGGMMPRYYIKFLGGDQYVDDLIGLSPSNQGTDSPAAPLVAETGECDACAEQMEASAFLNELNAGDQTPGDISYTVIQTRNDEVVTPYTNAFLPEGENTTNILLQDKCPEDFSEHILITNDPIAIDWTLNALGRNGPADPAHEPLCASTQFAANTDSDRDGVFNNDDNCLETANPDQADLDGDGAGDACDEDDDGDTVPDANDNCATTANQDQADQDGDALGDACDPDRDGDEIANEADVCPAQAGEPPSGCPAVAPVDQPVSNQPAAPAADRVAPETRFGRVPKRAAKSRRIKLTFFSSESGSTFFCRLDKRRQGPCTSPFRTPRLSRGKHVLRVYAVDRAGNADRTPAVLRWKIAKR